MLQVEEINKSEKFKAKRKELNRKNREYLQSVGTYITLDNGERVLSLPMGIRTQKIEQNPFNEDIQYPGSEFILPAVAGKIIED